MSIVDELDRWEVEQRDHDDQIGELLEERAAEHDEPRS